MFKKELRTFFKKQGVSPSKKLGQNFLISQKFLKKIVETAAIQPRETVLEVGPGLGNLTIELAKKAKKVVAVEKDLRLEEALKEKLKGFENIKIIRGDILLFRNFNSEINKEHEPEGRVRMFKISNSKNLVSDYKVVANLPYYIVSPFIRKFLEEKNKPKEMVLMVQKEVAQRICAGPPHLRRGYGGQAKMNLLAVSVQFYAEPKIVSYVSKKCFWPRPKVDGAIIKITPKNLSTRTVLVDRFFKVVKAGFSQPRKQLLNNLAKGLKLDKEKVRSWLSKNNIQPSQRPEALSVDDWVNLVKNFIS